MEGLIVGLGYGISLSHSGSLFIVPVGPRPAFPTRVNPGILLTLWPSQKSGLFSVTLSGFRSI